MKSILFKLSAVALATIFLFASCSDDDNNDPIIDPVFSTTGAYILNEGSYGDLNGAKLSYYDIDEKEVTGDLFKTQNNLGLGHLANDAIIYGGKMYFVVTGSNTLFVTDLSGKLIPEIGSINFAIDEVNKGLKEPRYIVAHKEHVYLDFYSGHVIKLDTTNLGIVGKLEMAAYPEQMAVVPANDELYVTNSDYMGDGSGKTVTVINLNTFKAEVTPIEVTQNPQAIISDGLGNLFVASSGDYVDVKDAVSIIDSKTKKVKKVLEETAHRFALLDNRLLMSRHQWVEVDKKWVVEAKYSEYDTFKDEFVDKSFITIPEEHVASFDNFHSMAVDPTTKDIYMTTYQAQEDGKVFVFTEKGIYKSHFSSKGQFPKKVLFIKKQTN